MSTFAYSVADFTAFTKIKSADVVSRFQNVKDFLNNTTPGIGIMNANIDATAAIARSKIAVDASNKAGVVVNDGTTGALASTPAPAQYQPLVGNAGAANPSFQALPLNQAAAVTGALPIANGGTGQATAGPAFDALSPNTTKGDLTVRNSTVNVRVPVGSNGQVLSADSTQATGVKWVAVGAVPVAPTYSAATAAGTASGTGGFVSGTYTTPSNVLWIEVKLVGGGGGGSGSGYSAWGSGGAGGTTSFGTLSATGGGAGGSAGAPGAGGTASQPTGSWTGRSFPGAAGGAGTFWSTNTANVTAYLAGGGGAASPFAGGGMGGTNAAGGNSGDIGPTNSGAGGGGGACSVGTNVTNYGGGGGGAGAFIIARIAPTANQTFAYSVGAFGTAGSAGTSGFAGGAGALGCILVTEHYQ